MVVSSKVQLHLVRVMVVLGYAFVQLGTLYLWGAEGRILYPVLFVLSFINSSIVSICFYIFLKTLLHQRDVQEAISNLLMNGLVTLKIENTRFFKNCFFVRSINELLAFVIENTKVIHNENSRFLVYANDFTALSSRILDYSKSEGVRAKQNQQNLSKIINKIEEGSKEIVSLNDVILSEKSVVLDLGIGIGVLEEGLDDLMTQTHGNQQSIAKGRRQVGILENKVNELSDKIRAVAQAMKLFKGSTQKISSVLGVINEIVERTHLLATNAAIEAARAGGIGKGFSVVATEIRMLADSSSQSIEDVELTIDETLLALKEAFGAVRDGSKLVDVFMATTAEVSSLFGQFEDFSNSVQNDIKKASKVVYGLSNTGSVVEKNTTLIKKLTDSYQTILSDEIIYCNMIASSFLKNDSSYLGWLNLSTEIGDLAGFLLSGSNTIEGSLKAFYRDEDSNALNARGNSRILSSYKLRIIEDRTDYMVGYLNDYSDGGIGIVSDQQFGIDHRFSIRILLTDALKDEFKCSDIAVEIIIVRVTEQKMVDNKEKYWVYGCRVLNITDYDKKVLVLLSNHAQKVAGKILVAKNELKAKETEAHATNPFFSLSTGLDTNKG